jgi:hypothetical protein
MAGALMDFIKKLDVPGEPRQTVTIRQLGSQALRAALEAKAAPARQLMAAQIDVRQARSDLHKEVARRGGAEALVAAVKADPVIAFDVQTLIARSVLSWAPQRTAPPAAETANWLAREILRLSKPSLFTEAVTK